MIALIIIATVIVLCFTITVFIPLKGEKEIFKVDGICYTAEELFDIADGLNSEWEVKTRNEVTDEDGITLVSCKAINTTTGKEVVIGIRKEMGINVEIINKSGWIR